MPNRSGAQPAFQQYRAIQYRAIMLPIENLLAFLATALVVLVIPGPSVLFVVGRSIALGRRAGVFSVVGNTLGTVPAVIAVAFGVGAIVTSSVIAFTAIKIAGAVYLIYLGVQAIRHRNHDVTDDDRPPTSTWKLLREGFIVGLTNPKVVAFTAAVLPQFVDPSNGPVWLQLLLLGVIFQVMALTLDSMWAMAAGSARAWFAKSPRRVAAMSTTGGVMMIGLGGTLAFSSSKA